MNVVYCCDDKFAEIFSVSVVSLFENNRDIQDINVYLIENALSIQSKIRINGLAEKYDRKITYISVESSVLERLEISLPKAYSIDAFSRLLMASFLPSKVERVMYFDCDTLILSSLTHLWETDISGFYAGMVNDGENRSYRKSLGLSGDSIYYNSGVLLADLKAWRENGIETKFIQFIQSRKGYVPIVDQGVLNAVLDGKIKMLPLKYNVYTVLMAFNYKEVMRLRHPYLFYSQEETEEACKAPAIIHFTNNFYLPLRPWIRGCEHPYGKLWQYYRKLTPWGENKLWDDSRSKAAKLYTSYCHFFPKILGIETTRFIQTYLFPLWHYCKGKLHSRKVC